MCSNTIDTQYTVLSGGVRMKNLEGCTHCPFRR